MDMKSLSKTLYQQPGSPLTDRFRLAIDEIQNGDKVLEIGVGWGEFATQIKQYRNIELSAVDIGSAALEKVSTHVQSSQLADISIEKLEYQDNAFDTVICLEVFEHLQNPYHALLEIQRVLKPEGKLIISIPNPLGGHLMIYPGFITHKFFRKFLRQNYFKINRLKCWGPVWNKDNVGVLLESKIRNRFAAKLLLVIFQLLVRGVQVLSSIAFLRIKSLYWCYIFVCTNKKHDMDKPLWIKQLEQTSDLIENRGWYHSSFHKKV